MTGVAGTIFIGEHIAGLRHMDSTFSSLYLGKSFQGNPTYQSDDIIHVRWCCFSKRSALWEGTGDIQRQN